jgi:DNA-directed RNA polymerase specialized sigma24 family protein
MFDQGDRGWPDVDEKIETWDLIRAIRTLPSHHRMLIALRFGADLDYMTVGKALGLSSIAARAATRRALSALKRELQGV